MIKSLKITIIFALAVAFYMGTSVLISSIIPKKNIVVRHKGKVVGLKIIGQRTNNSQYFSIRRRLNKKPIGISGSSNIHFASEDNLKLAEKAIIKDVGTKNRNDIYDANILTESASGVDPHITYKNALIQAKRISEDYNININDLTGLINNHKRKRILGLYGEEIVNVLELNISLKDYYATKK